MQKPTREMTAMARAVLEDDDVAAAMALADCLIENGTSGGERITQEYVRLLEDTLHSYKTCVLRGALDYDSHTPQMIRGDVLVDKSVAATLYENFWKCQQVAVSLNRQGLS